MSGVVKVNPDHPGAYSPFFEQLGKEHMNSALYLGYDLGDLACGFLAADCLRSLAFIEWIYVDIRHRREGIGGQLLDEFIRRAFAVGLQEIRACLVSERPDFAPADAFLISRGFQCTERQPEYEFSLKSLLDGKMGKAIKKVDPHVCPLKAVPPRLWKRYKQSIGYTETDEGPSPDLSVLYVENREIKGCLLLSPYGNGFSIDWLQSSSPKAMGMLIAGAVRNVSEAYSEDLILHATEVQPGVSEMIRRLTNGEEKETGALFTYELRSDGSGLF